jgi:glutamate/tyrosine decarboxylase-like PLP-dependent enzyme
MVFDGGRSVHDVAAAVAVEFLHENALNPKAFPSVGEIQSEVVDACAELFHGDTAAGFMTSGGTESILMAVKAARERGKAARGITAPEMIVPESAHAAFHKGAYYFGLKVHKTKVRDDWRADVDATAACVNENTVLVVGSAPQYPQGVIDPIPELAALAAEIGASFHTDACMGGFMLPFMEKLGYDVAPWDFRVDGVTTISADIHKLGYAPKGASVILHRDKKLRSYQTFLFDDWLGGFYGSPNMQGSRPGMPMATAWAVMQHLGMEGYLRLTKLTIETRDRMVAGIRAIDGVRVLGEPDAQMVAMASDALPGTGGARGVDVFAVGDVLLAKGWHLDRQGPPDTLHATVCAGNAPVIEEYLADLAGAVKTVGVTAAADRSTSYATLE